MKYMNAKTVLPDTLLDTLQNYIQGGCLYIPIREKAKKWGEVSGSRQTLDARNAEIRQAFQEGKTISQLADIHCLSIDSIRKILNKK